MTGIGYGSEYPVVRVVGDESLQVEVRRAAKGLFFYGELLKGSAADFMRWRQKGNAQGATDYEVLEDMRRNGCPGRTVDDLRRALGSTMALDAARRFASASREDVCVLALMGPTGVGKSVAAGHAMLEHGKRVGPNRTPGAAPVYTWVQANRLVGLSYFEEQDKGLLRDLERCGHLTVDELGADQATQSGKGRVTELLLARFAAKRATVITSNLTHKAFADVYGQALVDRIKSDGIDVDLSREKSLRERRAA